MTQPIFIISLPRSGSTLLQRMLAFSPQIASTAEPWLMLSLWGMREPAIGRAAYSHHTAATALNDFIDHIPHGEREFDAALRSFALALYGAAAQGKRYFLDKTPRYYLLLPYLQRIWPDAHVVLLVRHPLAILASIAETFHNGRFRWFEYWIDWIEGHRCMAEAIRRDVGSCRVVRYEDLVSNPATTVAGLCAWLGIPFTEGMVTSYKEKALSGRMGDHKGIEHYAGVSVESVAKWQTFFATRHRKAVARKMVARLSREDLAVIGYPAEQLLQEIRAIPSRSPIDLSGRLDTLINSLAYHCDFRYLQARYRAAQKGEKYAYGFYRAR